MSDASASLGTPKIASKPPEKLEERHGLDSLSQPSKGTNFADIFILDFQPPDMYNKKFLMVMLPNLGYFVVAALVNEYTLSSVNTLMLRNNADSFFYGREKPTDEEAFPLLEYMLEGSC